MSRPSSAPPDVSKPLELGEISRRIDALIEASPADETDVLWQEVAHHQIASNGRGVSGRQHLEKTVLIRVLDQGRVGSHRTGSTNSGDLMIALRGAIAQS